MVKWRILLYNFTKFSPEEQMSSVQTYGKCILRCMDTEKRLTTRISSAILWLSIKTWIDRGAVHISIPVIKGAGLPTGRKGSPPKFPILPGNWLLGRRRISAGLSHFYVKRYHGFSDCTIWYIFLYFPWTALRAVHFLFEIQKYFVR